MSVPSAGRARPQLSLRVTIESRLAWASTAMNAVRALLEDILGSDPGERFGLACSEAVNNSVIHAHREDAHLTVEIDVRVLEDRVEVHVADESDSPFPLERLLDAGPSPYETSDDGLPESGLGLWIMRQGTDDIRYEKSEKGGVLVLSVARRDAQGPAS